MPAESERAFSVERLLFLRSLPIAKPNSVAAQQIAASMRDVYFRRGERLFSLGEPADHIYFLVAGSARMSAPEAKDWDFDAPAVIGALDAFVQRPRTRDAIATTDTHA